MDYSLYRNYFCEYIIKGGENCLMLCNCPMRRMCESKREGHVHEFLGSARLAGASAHNHRFAGISGPAIPGEGSHVHEIMTRTDAAFGHHHFICLFSGPALNVGGGRHVHFANGRTSLDFAHQHRFIFATLIEEPIDQ